MKRLVYIAMVIMLFLAGCISATEQPETANTITDTVIPPPTSTKTPLPTATKRPSATPGIQTATLSRTPTMSPSSTSTPQNFSSLLTAQVSWNVCDGAEEPFYKNDLSLDGNWLAVPCDTNDPSKFSGAKIVKLDGAALWNVSYYENYGIFQEEGFSRGGEMKIAHWSKDGNFVYLYPYFCCVDAPGAIFFNYFQNTLALYRLDLRTGKVTTTLQPFTADVFSGYNASISPTDRYLAYVISKSPRDVYLNNLQTGDTFTITVDEQYIASGRFSWSQDGNKVIFVAVRAGWSDWNTSISNGVSYFLLDLKKGKSIRLFDKDDIYRVSWTQDDNIILHNASGKDGLFYDFQGNTFISVTSTPSP